MKKIISIISLLLLVSYSFAQSAGDKLIGVYYLEHDGDRSKVRFTKNSDNTYKGQVIWMEKTRDEKGNLRVDKKNPDASKRNTPADRIVLIPSVTYKDGVWANGQIYDPTRGKFFTVELKFKDDETLAVKGSWAIFSQTIYWKKLKE
ncbi:MAG: DUF2147 domain-containing protein [Paludibacteraceae bacterium]|nr:DUF2147 domain-containing protein [Paludibacteraceae bacterium]MBR2262334.1 DUF2147 domain-containing protein [Paludibacteraceae bacterium]